MRLDNRILGLPIEPYQLEIGTCEIDSFLATISFLILLKGRLTLPKQLEVRKYINRIFFNIVMKILL